VEHTCYKCQAAVEEGVPFCPHCGAPQIRVTPPEPQTESVPTSSTEAPPLDASTRASPWGVAHPTVRFREPIQWRQAWQGALLAGIGAAALSSLPVLALGFCIWIFLAGAVSVSLYRRRLAGRLIRAGSGMRIGALAGVFAFAMNAITSTLLFATEGDLVRKAMEDQMRNSVAKAPDPRTQELLQHLMNKLSTPEGMATFFLWVLVAMAALFVLFGAAGGALGASLASRRRGV